MSDMRVPIVVIRPHILPRVNKPVVVLDKKSNGLHRGVVRNIDIGYPVAYAFFYSCGPSMEANPSRHPMPLSKGGVFPTSVLERCLRHQGLHLHI